MANYTTGEFFVEQQIITPDESSAVRNNNVSHRSVAIGSCTAVGCANGVCDIATRSCSNCQTSGTNCTYELTVSGTHYCEEPAIRAWKDDDSSVVEADINVSSDGMFILAAKAWQVEGKDCTWEYEYALYNMNSDRAADGFSVPLPNDLSVGELAEIHDSAGFHDIPYHSGEVYDSTDWAIPGTLTSSIPWSVQGGSNNALYWGTVYNFRFQAPRAPTYSGSAATVTIDLYRSGSPSTVTAVSVGPTTTTHTRKACCYGGESCIETTECHCDDLSGVWTAFSSCASAPCSMAP